MQKAKHTNMNARGPLLFAWGRGRFCWARRGEGLRPGGSVCGGAGCGGMRASRPTDARLVTGIPFGPEQEIYS